MTALIGRQDTVSTPEGFSPTEAADEPVVAEEALDAGSIEPSE